MTKETTARASLSYIRLSPRKLTRITRLITGKTYEESLSLLAFLPYTICTTVIKVLRAAAGNANQKLKALSGSGVNEQVGRKVFFVTAYVHKGPLMKRLRPAAKGRGWQFLRRTSHLTVELRW